jgi:hypothetical protein
LTQTQQLLQKSPGCFTLIWRCIERQQAAFDVSLNFVLSVINQFRQQSAKFPFHAISEMLKPSQELTGEFHHMISGDARALALDDLTGVRQDNRKS